MKIKYPKNQLIWLTYCVDDKPIYLVTSDTMRQSYTLYKVKEDGSIDKYKTSKTPLFQEIYPQ